MVSKKIECPDCDGPGLHGNGDGRCSACHGTGKEGNVVTALVEALRHKGKDCEKCGGSGECQTCHGKGYLNI